MALNNHILFLIGNKAVLSILFYLHGIQTGLTGRKIAAMTNLSHNAANKALARLAEYDVVHVVPAGRAYLYTLNHEHLLVQHGLSQLFSTLSEWPTYIGAYYVAHLRPAPMAIVLFGSCARGEATRASDLDLLFVYEGRDAQAQMADIVALNGAVRQLWGTTPAPIIRSRAQFRAEAKKRTGLVANILRDGQSIAGATITELLQP